MGYQLDGAPTAECLPFEDDYVDWAGYWSNPPPSCIAVQCEQPTAPENGAMSGDTRYQSVIQFRCQRGYEIEGDERITCQADGTWSGNVPVCRDIDGCSPNPCAPRATCTDTPAPGIGATCTCEPGYEGDGTADGTGCNAVRCSQPVPPANGDMSWSHTYMEEVVFTCREGYRLVGARSVTCQHDRTWSDSFPTCTDIDGCSPNPCAPLATCADVLAPGTGATCTCAAGYDGDGTSEGTGCTGRLDLVFTNVGVDHVTVTWTGPDDLDIAGYQVRYSHGGGPYRDLVPPPDPNSTAATVRGLWADTEYTVVVTSLGEGGEKNGEGNGVVTTAKVVVDVECSEGTMRVSIPLAALPGVDLNSLHLLDHTCMATVGPAAVTLETGLTECGTIKQANTEYDKFIFMNEVISEQVTLENGAVRGTDFRRRFQCEFHRQFVISQGREIMYNIPSPSVEIVDADDILTFNLNMFTSADFSTMYDSSDFPLVMSSSDRLYFGLSLDTELDVLELFALQCVATPTTDPTAEPNVRVIHEGNVQMSSYSFPVLCYSCHLDPTITKDDTRSSDTALYYSVDAFTIPNADDSRLVYFHCTMLVCLKDDPDSRCKQGCISSRRRRALTQEIRPSTALGKTQAPTALGKTRAPTDLGKTQPPTDLGKIRVRRESITERRANISQGPIIIADGHDDHVFPTIGVAMGTVGAVLGVMLLVAALGRGRKKRDQDIKEMAAERCVVLDNSAFLSMEQMKRWGANPAYDPE
ncbi:uncharacterized protein LOC118405495 [Branchiostoma floridae]|uniref:Uncharacterized protein LOC118405495 n=1 Tax=Branchiostoma floridae TaxID=7739 RepID=A0A9J7HM89_BRAFL|nr:uncharacterized protein LOC118405495 [Branchiostoma floridae]